MGSRVTMWRRTGYIRQKHLVHNVTRGDPGVVRKQCMISVTTITNYNSAKNPSYMRVKFYSNSALLTQSLAHSCMSSPDRPQNDLDTGCYRT
jgi:hypothetical protein